MSASKNRLQDPSFVMASSNLPIAALTDGVALESVKNWFLQSFADGGTPITIAATQVAFPLTQNVVPGEPVDYLSLVFGAPNANLGPNSYFKLYNRLSPRVLNGLQAVFSFWMNSSTPARSVGVIVRRNYGTGGSPSPDDIFAFKSRIVRAALGWNRYIVEGPLTNAGDPVNVKTFGSNNDAFIEVAFYFQAGKTAAGTQSTLIAPPAAGDTILITQPQLEAGVRATGWVDGDPLNISADGNTQVYDSVSGTWRELTAPGGILTVT